MTCENLFTKDPNAVLDFTVDWTSWLGTDTIDTSEWIVPSGITKESDTNNTLIAIIWLSGGTVGVVYNVVNRITTNGGRTEDRTIKIRIVEK